MLRLGESVVVGLLAVGLLALWLAPSASAADRVKLRGSVPAYADSAARVGSVPADQQLSFQVVLGLRDRAGARKLARQVSEPRNDSYREFISASKFRKRFSWRKAQIRPVARWLREQGLKVEEATRNGVLLPASGTATDFERAFQTTLGVYRAFGQELVAPRSQLRVPRSFSRMVHGTIGVPEAPISPHVASPPARAGGATATDSGAPSSDPGPPLIFDAACAGEPGCPFGTPGVAEQPPPPNCARAWGFSASESDAELGLAYGQIPLLAICGYGAKKIRSAYRAQKLYRKGFDGSGVDIGIVTGYLSPTLQSDLDTYSDDNNIPSTRLRISTPSGYAPADPLLIWDVYGEQTLDTQVSHGMAPGARIHYSGPDLGVGSPVLSGVNEQIMADSELVDRNRVEVISNSWGFPEIALPKSIFRAGEDIFMQAAAQGITMLYSSGDTGDGIASPPAMGFGIRTVQYPGSSRWVTAVGGTTLAVGPTGERVWEQGWGESAAGFNQVSGAWEPTLPGIFSGGSTGGASRVFRQPGYQRGKVPKGPSGYYGGRARVVPDVALLADPMSGPGIVQTGVEAVGGPEVVIRSNIGGTSVAAPAFAGAVAVMADRNGGRLGFLNPSLYRVRGKAIRRVGPVRKPAVSALIGYANARNASDGYQVALLTGGQYGTLSVRRGYDDVTGLGSPSVQKLAKRLRQMSR
ncbi:MAG: S53 family peptidase [Solirubrobacterales bacterium]